MAYIPKRNYKKGYKKAPIVVNKELEKESKHNNKLVEVDFVLLHHLTNLKNRKENAS
jgi:hypothetical protein